MVGFMVVGHNLVLFLNRKILVTFKQQPNEVSQLSSKLFASLLLALILLLPLFYYPQQSTTGYYYNDISSQKNIRNNAFDVFWDYDTLHLKTPIEIVFLGFDQNLIMIDNFLTYLEDTYTSETGLGNIITNFNFTCQFANESFTNSFNSFVNSIAKNSSTSALDENTLIIQRNKVIAGDINARYSIFTRIDGIAIDAVAVENWLNEHSPDTDSKYYLYILNLSRFDINGKKHWFAVDEIDVDSNRTRDFWRLEWENDLNPNVSFPYAGFSSNSRIMYFDPYAHNWYLSWARIWWDNPKHMNSLNARFWMTLDDFEETLDLNTTDGKLAITKYIAGWADDFLDDLLGISLEYNLINWNRQYFFTNSISVQVIIFNEAEDVIPTDQLQWIVHYHYLREALNEIIPFTSIDINITLKPISEYPEISSLLEASEVSSISTAQWSYYNGYTLYWQL